MGGPDSSKSPLVLDRQKVCPFLMRIFLCKGRHNNISDYTNRKTPPKPSELQIYTWLDATLSELMGLIREMPQFRSKGTQFGFSIVFPEPTSPTYRMRSIGVTVGGKKNQDDELTLSQCRYQIGDFIDVAILPTGVDAARLNSQSNTRSKAPLRNRGRGLGRSHR